MDEDRLNTQVELAIQGMEESVHMIPEDAKEEEREFWIRMVRFTTENLSRMNQELEYQGIVEGWRKLIQDQT